MRPIKYWALSSDANLDGSQTGTDFLDAQGNVIQFATRTISTNEIVGLPNPYFVGPFVFQALYNILGTTTGISLKPDSSTGITKVTPFADKNYFLLNDLLLTEAS